MSDSSAFWSHAIKESAGLDTVDRVNEILFGLIMVLTFTCSISAATAGREEVSTVLWSALGCNIAWGFIDACMYLLGVLLERGESFASIRGIRSATTEAGVSQAVRNAVPPFVSRLLKDDHIIYLGREIRNLPEPPARVRISWKDVGHASTIFLMVFLSTFPITLPFLLIGNAMVAMRVSNAVALVLLFCTGVLIAKQTGRKKILTGLGFACIGFAVVGMTIALGG